MTAPLSPPVHLHWDEPDAGCVSCGQAVVTVADHRCGTCLAEPVRHCPHCLGDVADLIDREVAHRLRQASHDVNDEWLAREVFDRVKAAMQASTARTPEAAAIRAANLRHKLRGAA